MNELKVAAAVTQGQSSEWRRVPLQKVRKIAEIEVAKRNDEFF
jgi:hypothetical protein